MSNVVQFPGIIFREPSEPNISFTVNGDSLDTPALKITPSGFFVQGRKVETGPGHDLIVYTAVLDWLKQSNILP